MKKRILAVLLAFALILSCVPVLPAAAADSQASSGTTYYVSSLHGAEGNNGTSEDTPFASLLKINEITLQPGDQVLLERGSVFVDEYLHVQGSGSADAPIIIDVYGDETAAKPLIQTNGYGVWYQDYGKSLDNSNHVRQGYVSSCILLYDVEYIEISNIAMTNEGNYADGEVYNTAYRMDRTGVAGVAENKGTVDHIVLDNLDIYNVEGNVYNKHMCNGGIYFVCHLPDDVNATGPAKYDDVRITNCTLDNVNRWGIAVGYTAHWDEFAYGSSIDATVCQTYGSTNVYIANNYLTNIGGDGITTMYCYQPLIEYNVLSGYCQDITDAIYVHEGNRGGQVAAGIWPWMCKSAIFQYNECYDSTYNQDGQAWDADWGDNAIYQYNYSSNNAGGAVMFCGTYACNTVFRYNISQNDLSGVLNLAGSPNGEIYNNVFYIKEGVKINRTGMSGGWGNTISNNIFYYAGETPADSSLGNWGDITAVWSNNVYYNYATTPADENAITEDPLFVNAGSAPTGAQASGLVYDRSVFDGYKLQENSPAIDAGTPISNNGGLDFFGNELDLIPDIGAYDAGTCDADADSVTRVTIPLGGTVTLSDLTGDYTASELSGLDTKIASLALERLESITVDRVSDAVTELEAGASYIICNVNTGSAVTTTYESAPDWGTNALRLSGGATIADNNVWTLEASGSGYKIRSAAGTYINISLNDSALDSVGDVFTPAYSNGSWNLLAADGNYLDNLGRKDYLGGWTEVGNSSTWNFYKVTQETIDAATELTFTGLYPGTTNVVVGRTLYQIKVTGNAVEVPLEVGESVTLTDDTGVYTDADIRKLDTSVATVTLEGVAGSVSRSLSAAVTAIVSGRQYVIVNTRAGKPVTNAPATAAAAAGAGSGLSLDGSKDYIVDAMVWTIEAVDGGYTVKDLNSNYMTIGSTTASVSATAATLSIARNGDTWTINQDGAYLNHFGGASSTCAAGWQDSTAAGDSGSQWEIYEAISTSEVNATEITFTGVGEGTASVQIGQTVYVITVTDTAHTHTFDQEVATSKFLASEATCKAAATYYYSCTCGERGTGTFTYGELADHAYDDNGFCEAVTGETHYEPAVLNEGVYEISNGGQLYWFAQQVDGGNLDIDAVLTDDIVVNRDVLIDGELNEDGDFRNWNAIGSNSKKYAGTFDGNGKTVSGLYYNSDRTTSGYIGLVASLNEGGVVKNVNVADTYICGYRYIGAIVGENYGGTVENCSSAAVVTGSSSYIGGIVGGNTGFITGCINSGSVSSEEGNNLGGIAGSNTGTVTLCYNTGSILSECCSDEHCLGGVVGLNDEGTIENCYNVGSVTSDGKATGGIVGKIDRGTLTNCHNFGSVSGATYAGGVIGITYNNPTINNCYYKSGCATDGSKTIQNGIGNKTRGSVTADTTATVVKTAEEFASGEVTYLLNGSASEGELVWFQTLTGETPDRYPVFEGDTVYYGYTSCAGDAVAGYTNDSTASENKPDHDPDENGLCTVCGYQYAACVTTAEGVTTFHTLRDATDAANASSGSTLKLLKDISGEDNGGSIVLTFSGTCTLDLNGKTVNLRVSVNGADLTVVDTAETKGTIVNYAGVAILYSSGQVTIDASTDCLGEAEGHRAWNVARKDETVEGGTVGTTGTEDIVIPEGCVMLRDYIGEEITVLPEADYVGTVHRHADSATDTDHKCDTCPKVLSQCADGNTDHKCDLCGETLSDCTGGEPVIENEVKATCTEAGSYDEVVYCTECDEELSRETKTVEKLAHTPDEAVIEKEVKATCEKGGSYDEVVYCTECDEELSRKTVTVDALGHKDEDKDHKCDTCEEVISECVDENKDYKCDICGAELEKPEEPETDEVIRLAGAHRWETAIKVADEMKANLGVKKFNTIIIASGNDFADALAGSYLSTVKSAPILLSWGQGGKYEYLDEDNIAYIKANLAEGGTVYILGGEKAVPTSYETALEGYTVKRLGGANRFETNLLILKEAGVNAGDEILVCTSTNFADSLSASATGMPILLVFNEYGKLYGEQPEYLADLENCTFTIVGGENAVCAELETEIGTYGDTERLAGENRFETSVMVAETYFEAPETAVLAYAWNYPDGLCGGALAYSMDAPLVLTMTNYEDEAVAYATSNSITSGVVLGGDGLISDEAVRSIFAMDVEDEIIVK